MAQYIDKSALVAEIEKLRDELQEKVETSDFIAGEVFIMNYFLSFLNTLEVKEVDLESEIDRVWDNTSDNFSEDGWKEFEKIAKHFFELGLQSQITTSKLQQRISVLKMDFWTGL